MGSESDCTENEEHNESQFKRAPSLSEHERSVLCGLVAKYKLIVESKHTTSQWVAKKQATWNMIMNEFMAKPGTSIRTAKQLKKCYENYKRMKKKNEMQKPVGAGVPLQRTKEAGAKKIYVRHVNNLKSTRSTRSNINQIGIENNGNGSKGSEYMENELHSKKVRLVNLQIEYEEMKIRFLQEEHDLRMTLLQKRSNDPLFVSDDMDIKTVIL